MSVVCTKVTVTVTVTVTVHEYGQDHGQCDSQLRPGEHARMISGLIKSSSAMS